jgi:Tol biopolymer transport system component
MGRPASGKAPPAARAVECGSLRRGRPKPVESESRCFVQGIQVRRVSKDPEAGSPATRVESPGPARLESWKAIAAYLSRDISTVQRWEKREGMPVHRHLHDKIGSVYAYATELDGWWQSRRLRLEQEEEPPALPHVRALPWRGAARAAVAGLALAAAAALGFWLGTAAHRDRTLRRAVRFQRITDMVGLEESPALSPDGRTVAFAAAVGNVRHIFVRLIAGGPPLRITSDPADHDSPRWLPDSSGLVYLSPAAPGDSQGHIWEVPALGGTPRRVMGCVSDADVASDGRLACFRLERSQVQLVAFARDGSVLQVVGQFVPGRYYRCPRWSPDGRWIAYQQGDGVRFDVFAVRSDATGQPLQLTRDSSLINGLCWTPDGRSVVYSSTHDSTLPYLPPFGLWEARLDGGRVEPITTDEASYGQPDALRTGTLVASRLRMQSDLWTFPVDGPARENVRRGLRLTHQTGQVRTPTVSPVGGEVAFLSDSGGHANLWVMDAGSGELRQITRERDPGVAVGVPIWSPDGRSIAFVSSRGNRGFVFGLWIVNPDGSGLKMLAQHGWGAGWSADGQWLYFVDEARLKKVPAQGGPATTVRSEQVRNVIGSHGGTLYYVVERPLVDGRPDFEIRAASPEDGASRVLARVPASRVASWQIVNPSLSPDGQWLALPLTDAFTTNVWALSTLTGQWRQVTDFGDRATHVARRVSWSADGRSIVAAVTDADSDIVLAEGLLGGRQPDRDRARRD